MTNKNKIIKACNTISLVLVVVFVIKTIINYFQYSPLINSAPFYVWVLLNAVYLLLPAVVIYVVGVIIKNK